MTPIAGGCFHTGTWEILDECNVEKIARSNTTTCHVRLKSGLLNGKPATVIVSGPNGTYTTGCNGDNINIRHRADAPGLVNFVVYRFSS